MGKSILMDEASNCQLHLSKIEILYKLPLKNGGIVCDIFQPTHFFLASTAPQRHFIKCKLRVNNSFLDKLPDFRVNPGKTTLPLSAVVASLLVKQLSTLFNLFKNSAKEAFETV